MVFIVRRIVVCHNPLHQFLSSFNSYRILGSRVIHRILDTILRFLLIKLFLSYYYYYPELLSGLLHTSKNGVQVQESTTSEGMSMSIWIQDRKTPKPKDDRTAPHQSSEPASQPERSSRFVTS